MRVADRTVLGRILNDGSASSRCTITQFLPKHNSALTDCNVEVAAEIAAEGAKWDKARNVVVSFCDLGLELELEVNSS